MYDVVVVGGGPVGSQVAYRLAGMGYQVVVLERKERLGGPVCCTGIISRECVDTFAIDRGVILKPLDSIRLYSPSGKLIRLWWEEPQAYVVARAAFDVAMASRAQSVGAEYVFNSPAANVEVKEDKVKVEAALQFEARVAVVATGFGSKLGKRLGLAKSGDFAVGAQTEVEVNGIDEVEVYFGQEIAPGFFSWLVPISPQRALLGLLSRQKPGFYLRRLASSLLARGKTTSAGAELNYGGILLKAPRRTCGERLLLVGGAAGQVKPTTGGGIYYGLLCAEIAANNLDRALKSNDLSAGNLAKYERDWKSKLGRELRMGYYARRFHERLSDGKVDRLFDIIQSNGIDKALLGTEGLSFDWHGKVLRHLLKHRAMFKAMVELTVYLIPIYLGGRF